jgi:hypothetical protein
MDCFEFMVLEIMSLSKSRTEEETILFVEDVLLSGYNITKESK